MSLKTELIKRNIYKSKYLRHKKKYRREIEIKIKPRKKKYKFKSIIFIFLFILTLFFVSFFSFKTINKRLNVYPKDDLTIVSAYYKIKKSKYNSNLYLIWVSNIAKLNKSMVFFTNKEFMPIFKKMRPKSLYYKTVFIELEFEEYFTYKTLYKEFNETYKLDPEAKKHSIPLYMIWAEKAMFVKKAIKQNYFRSKYFYWVDAGYFREGENGMKRYINNWPSTKYISEDDRVIIGNVKKFNESEKQKLLKLGNNAGEFFNETLNVAGGFFGGQIKNLLKFIDLYYDTVRMFYKNNLFMGKDQNLFTYMAFAHPEIIKLIQLRGYFTFKRILYYD